MERGWSRCGWEEVRRAGSSWHGQAAGRELLSLRRAGEAARQWRSQPGSTVVPRSPAPLACETPNASDAMPRLVSSVPCHSPVPRSLGWGSQGRWPWLPAPLGHGATQGSGVRCAEAEWEVCSEKGEALVRAALHRVPRPASSGEFPQGPIPQARPEGTAAGVGCPAEAGASWSCGRVPGRALPGGHLGARRWPGRVCRF